MRILLSLAVAILAGLSAGIAVAAECRAQSGDRVTPLVELYTSEGCDSCPPADRWLSTHFPAGDAGGAVALAFHVDYWDRLGWKDRFASPAFTDRQYEAMRANRATFVYTPQLLLQGRDFTAWRRGAPTTALATAAAREPRARIGIVAANEASALAVDVSVRLAEAPRRATILGVAFVGSRLSSEVKAGENRGVTLRHDHVVRTLLTRPLAAAESSIKLTVSRPAEAGAHPSLVAFVQDMANGEVLQTVALPLEGCR